MRKPAPATLHQKLREQVLATIHASAAHTSLPAERDLAKHFGVARGTMEKVMRELQLEGWVTRHVGRGTFVSARDQAVPPDRGAGQQRDSLIVAYPDFFSHFVWSLVHAADTICRNRGLDLQRLVLQPLTDYTALIELLEMRAEVKGVALLFPGTEVPRSVLRRLDACGKPVVLLARQEESGFRNITYVCTDDFMVGYLKADCLLRAGHRHLGYIRNEPDVPAMARQQEGVKTAFQDHDVPLANLVWSTHDVHHWEYTGKAAAAMTRDLLQRHPTVTGLITDSMPGGFGALRALHELGLQCPRDLSVVTSMTHAGFEELTAPALTAVVCSPEVHMQKAIDIITDPACQHERAITIGATLIARESVRPLTAAAAATLTRPVRAATVAS